jgi:hypothetical protein
MPKIVYSNNAIWHNSALKSMGSNCRNGVKVAIRGSERGVFRPHSDQIQGVFAQYRIAKHGVLTLFSRV